MENNVRKGLTNAKFNEENSNILFGEMGIAAIALGSFFESWYIGGGVLLILFIMLMIKPLAILLGML